jgi:glutamate-1-semialdehyde 2,1-aminomutase
LPVGAFGGRAEIMDVLAPDGPVYQAGTLSGNPLAMAAGIAALEELQSGAVYERLEVLGARLEKGLNAAAEKAGVPVVAQRAGSMSCLFFADHPVNNLTDAMLANRERFNKYFHGMLAQGVYLAPSAFEAAFLSAAHTETDVDATISAAEKVMRTL